MVNHLKEGDYDEAIYQATATEPKDGEMTAARSYDELDAELSDLIGQGRFDGVDGAGKTHHRILLGGAQHQRQGLGGF